MALGAPIAGWLADRSSSRRTPLLTGLALAFAATMIFYVARAPWALLVARVFQGFSAIVIYTAGLALVADTVPADEVGTWMGFVLSGMNGGALIAPFLAGAIYDRAGYYTVFGVCLGIVGFDFILRLTIIEKSTACRWLDAPAENGRASPLADDEHTETKPLLSNDSGSGASSGTVISERVQGNCSTPDTDETPSLLHTPQKSRQSWFAREFPAMMTLLCSRRILAAVYGCFTHTLLISSFDAVLALCVKRTFLLSPTGAGLIFLAITIPSTLGAFIGALSDRIGTRAVALFGFALTVPSLACLGVVTDRSTGHQAALIVLVVANGELSTAFGSEPLLIQLSGIGLNFILTRLAADMFDEVEVLAEQNPGTFGNKGAYAQAYSLFDAALGLATVVGPGWSGLVYESTNWQITAGTMAILYALGGAPVFCFTGRTASKKQKGKGKLVTGAAEP
ncbi:MAG: hypothetical protein Q9217_004265 [Psora testacea]